MKILLLANLEDGVNLRESVKRALQDLRYTLKLRRHHSKCFPNENPESNYLILKMPFHRTQKTFQSRSHELRREKKRTT